MDLGHSLGRQIAIQGSPMQILTFIIFYNMYVYNAFNLSLSSFTDFLAGERARGMVGFEAQTVVLSFGLGLV